MQASLATARGSETATDDCWNRIGVHGDNSCTELRQHIHCRRCPVYATAATALLDRDLPPESIAAWTRHFAEPRAAAEAGANR